MEPRREMSRLQSISLRLAAEESFQLLKNDSGDTTATQSLYESQPHPFNSIDWSQSPSSYYRLPPMKELGIHLSNFTISCWVRIDKFARAGVGHDETNTILGQPPYRKDRNLIVGVRQRRLFFSFTDDDTYGKTELQPKKWYHAAFVYDLAARTQAIYLNGRRDAYGENRGPTATTGNLFIAACENSRKLYGALAEFHIYTHALTQHDIRRLIERDQCGYQQVTPNWTSFYNVYDENLPKRPTDRINDSCVITTDPFQSSAPEVKIIDPDPSPTIRSTFLPANGKNKSHVACTCCRNAMDLLNSGAALKMNIDYFPKIQFKVVLAAYKVSLKYQGPIFRLRRADDDVELDFFSDNEGNLTNQSHSHSFEGWSNGSDAYVVTWYTQTGESQFHAQQKNPNKQPKYNGSKRVVEFYNGAYLELNPLALPVGNGSYTYVVKHGEIHNPRGGLFGIGRGSSASSGVSLQRLPLHSSYRSYWIDNDHQFTGFQSGNEVFEVYDADKRIRLGGVNGKVTGDLQDVPPRDMKVSRAVLGKSLEYQGMNGNYHMDGEMEYFVTSYQSMTPNEIGRLYQPGMKIYDNCLACPNCDALFQIDCLRNISHIAVRFNDKSIEELNFCYTRGAAQRQFVKKLPQSITVPFRLNAKLDERIARVVFQQTAELGLVNIFFVTNTARQSPLYGGAWIYENAEHVTYAYTAPASSGGVAGLLLTAIQKVFGLENDGKENDLEKNKGFQDRSATSRSDKFKQMHQNKVVTGIILRNGKVFKISLKPPAPKPTLWESLFCCMSNKAVYNHVNYAATSSRIEALDRQLAVSPNRVQRPSSKSRATIFDNHASTAMANNEIDGERPDQYEEHEYEHFQQEQQQDDQEHQEHVHVSEDSALAKSTRAVEEKKHTQHIAQRRDCTHDNDLNKSNDNANDELNDQDQNQQDAELSNCDARPPSLYHPSQIPTDTCPDDLMHMSSPTSPVASPKSPVLPSSPNSPVVSVPITVPTPSKPHAAANPSILPPKIPKAARSNPTSANPSPTVALSSQSADPQSPSGKRGGASPVIPLGKRGNSPAIPLLPPANYRAASPAGSASSGNNTSRTNSFLNSPPQQVGVKSSSRPSSATLQQPGMPNTFLAKLSFYSQKSTGAGSYGHGSTSVAQICDGLEFVDIPEQGLQDVDSQNPSQSQSTDSSSGRVVHANGKRAANANDKLEASSSKTFTGSAETDVYSETRMRLGGRARGGGRDGIAAGGQSGTLRSLKPELVSSLDYEDDDQHRYDIDVDIAKTMRGRSDDDDEDDDNFKFSFDPAMTSSTDAIHDLVYIGANTSTGVKMVWLQDELTNVMDPYYEDGTEGDGYVDYFELANESSSSFFDFGHDRPVSAQMFRDSMRFSFSRSDADDENEKDGRGLRPSILEQSMVR